MVRAVMQHHNGGHIRRNHYLLPVELITQGIVKVNMEYNIIDHMYGDVSAKGVWW